MRSPAFFKSSEVPDHVSQAKLRNCLGLIKNFLAPSKLYPLLRHHDQFGGDAAGAVYWVDHDSLTLAASFWLGSRVRPAFDSRVD